MTKRRRLGLAAGIAATLLLAGTGTAGATAADAGSGDPGVHAVKVVVSPDLPNHTLYVPQDVPAGSKLPVLAWGEGGCFSNGLITSFAFLKDIAAHGFLVIANGGPAQFSFQTATDVSYFDQTLAWVAAQNSQPGSPYQGKLAANKIAVAGWSCGGLQSYREVAKNPAVTTLGIFDSGLLIPNQAILDTVKIPTLYVLGGPRDIAYRHGEYDFAHLPAGTKAFVASKDTGHLGTFWQPHGGAWADVAVSWLRWQLKGSTAAAKQFVGPQCGLCVDPAWTVERHNLG